MASLEQQEHSEIEREMPPPSEEEDSGIERETPPPDKEELPPSEEEEECNCEAVAVGACCLLISSVLCFCCLCLGVAREEITERVVRRGTEHLLKK